MKPWHLLASMISTDEKLLSRDPFADPGQVTQEWLMVCNQTFFWLATLTICIIHTGCFEWDWFIISSTKSKRDNLVKNEKKMSDGMYISIRQLNIFFDEAKTWHWIACWFCWISLNSPVFSQYEFILNLTDLFVVYFRFSNRDSIILHKKQHNQEKTHFCSICLKGEFQLTASTLWTILTFSFGNCRSKPRPVFLGR